MTRHPRPPGHNGHASPALLLTLVHGELAHVEDAACAARILAKLVVPAQAEDAARAARLVESLIAIDPAPHAAARAHATLAYALAWRGQIEQARRALALAEESIDPAQPRTPALLAHMARAGAALGEQHWTQTARRAVDEGVARRDRAWRDAIHDVIAIYNDASHAEALHPAIVALDPTSAALEAAADGLDVALRGLIAQGQLDALGALWFSVAERAPRAAARCIASAGSSLAMRGKIALALAMLDQLDAAERPDAALNLLRAVSPLGQPPLIEAIASWARRARALRVLAAAGHAPEALAALRADADGPPDLMFEVCCAAGQRDAAAGQLDLLEPSAVISDALVAARDEALNQVVIDHARAAAPERRSAMLAACAAALHALGRPREAELLAQEAIDAASANTSRGARASALEMIGTLLATRGAPELAAPLLSLAAAKPAHNVLARVVGESYARASDVAGAARCLALMEQGIERMEAAALCYLIVSCDTSTLGRR
jgi:hypothetical protein